MNVKLMKQSNGTFAEAKVELTEEGRFTIICVTGRVLAEKHARREALDYWTSFFEENPGERHAMNDKFDKNLRTARGAARFVIESDGEYHGLDLHTVSCPAAGFVYVADSCGVLDEDTAEKWFPRTVPYLKWHLNDMKSTCEHQEARGETWTTHPEAKCPECGYVLGSAWLKRELPAEVIAWVKDGCP